MTSKFLLHPDDIPECWNTSVREYILGKGVYCLLDSIKIQELVSNLLDQSMNGVRSASRKVYLSADRMNGKERRDKEGGHIKIILESLGRDPHEFDNELLRLGCDMVEVNRYYQDRVGFGMFYRTGVVTEK